MKDVNKYYAHSRTDCALHYKNNYRIQEASELPVWVFMEFTTLGNLRTLIQNGVKNSIQVRVKEAFGFRDNDFFLSALSLIHEARNTCAHQGRVWNIKWKYMQREARHDAHLNDILKEPSSPEWNLRWHHAQSLWIPNGKGPRLISDKSSTAALLTLCSAIMRQIAPESHWQERVMDLFDTTALTTAEREIGFTCREWRLHPLWQ